MVLALVAGGLLVLARRERHAIVARDAEDRALRRADARSLLASGVRTRAEPHIPEEVGGALVPTGGCAPYGGQ
jgi:hypothetical protein